MNYPPLHHHLDLANMRIMPHSLEAEQSVIGALFLDERTLDRVASIVTTASFHRHNHRLIWNAALELLQNRCWQPWNPAPSNWRIH